MGMRKIRRPHRKSRNGCITCKKRRVKCGEEKPTCLHCQERSTECVYPPAPPQRPAEGSSQPAGESLLPLRPVAPRPADALPSESSFAEAGSPQARGLSPSLPVLELPSNGELPPSELFEMRDLVLLHYWSTTTSMSMLRTSWIDRLFRDVLPQVAFRHPYLLHAILSLTALHVAYQNPCRRQELVIEAVRHHNKAIPGFLKAMDNLTQENCDAVFGTAVINLVYVFATFGKSPGREDAASSPVSTGDKSKILGIEWINLIRGVGAVIRPTIDNLRAGPLSHLASIGDWEEIDPDLEPTTEGDGILLRLQDIWRTGAAEEAELYDQSLRNLRQTMAWMNKCRTVNSQNHFLGPFIWLHFIPEGYIDRLWQRQPPALILFAYFGAVVHSLDEFWWAEGWGREIVDELGNILGPYWQPWLEWPRQVVGMS